MTLNEYIKVLQKLEKNGLGDTPVYQKVVYTHDDEVDIYYDEVDHPTFSNSAILELDTSVIRKDRSHTYQGPALILNE